MLLETSWEAVEHAGLTPQTITGSLTGVFVGLTHYDYQMVAAQSPDHGGAVRLSGQRFQHGVRADRLCAAGAWSRCHRRYRLLVGPVRCAPGVQQPNEGESDLALAGGACVMLDPRKFAAASAQSMLSPTGRCHAFDAAADGFVSGEGAAVVLLKRLPDALRDGDRVLAVMRGTAANQDGRTVHIGTPSQQAQSAVYRKALAAGRRRSRHGRHGRSAWHRHADR